MAEAGTADGVARGAGTGSSRMAAFLSGEALYGDDFDQTQIERWFADEAEAYASLGAGDGERYRYAYHAWNRLHGFAHLEPGRRFRRALAFGSAWGDELEPILDRLDAVTMVDPSDSFVRDRIGEVPARYVKPVPSGALPLEDASHDLATCFGVLHHIPNVSRVVAEIARVLEPGATLLLREPTVSMGDWSRPRAGLTPHERGIPHPLLRRICTDAGFEVVRDAACGFSLTPRLFGRFVPETYNSMAVSRIDSALCTAFGWNRPYHATSAVAKLRPTCAYLVLRRR